MSAGGTDVRERWLSETGNGGSQYGGQDYGRGGQDYSGGSSWGSQRGGGQQYGGGQGGSQWSGGFGQMGGGQQYGGGFGQQGRGGQTRQRGLHTGKGPKGYRRSDERIREEISDALMNDAEIDASEIEIEVQNGEVVLRGSVDSREAKRAAEDLAESVQGVNDVRNEIRVSRGDTGRGATNGREGDREGRQAGREQQAGQAGQSGIGGAQSGAVKTGGADSGRNRSEGGGRNR